MVSDAVSGSRVLISDSWVFGSSAASGTPLESGDPGKAGEHCPGCSPACTATLRAGLLFTATHAPTPLYYVFGDLNVLTPSEVHHYSTHTRHHSSGAWVLVATRQAHHFEEVFGTNTAFAA